MRSEVALQHRDAAGVPSRPTPPMISRPLHREAAEALDVEKRTYRQGHQQRLARFIAGKAVEVSIYMCVCVCMYECIYVCVGE